MAQPLASMTSDVALTHKKETAVQLAQDEGYTTKVVSALDEAITDTKDIIQEAREAESYHTAIAGLKVLAQILETQAKIMGVADKHASKSNQTLHLHMNVSQDEVKKLAEDYKSTTIEIESQDG